MKKEVLLEMLIRMKPENLLKNKRLYVDLKFQEIWI